MAHDCPACGELCHCDMEDAHGPAPADCSHDCGPDVVEDYEDLDDDLEGDLDDE